MGYLEKSKCYRFFCPFGGNKIIEPICKIPWKSNYNGSLKECIFLKKNIKSFLFQLVYKMEDMSTDKNILEPQSVIEPIASDLHKPIESVIEMSLRRSDK